MGLFGGDVEQKYEALTIGAQDEAKVATKEAQITAPESLAIGRKGKYIAPGGAYKKGVTAGGDVAEMGAMIIKEGGYNVLDAGAIEEAFDFASMAQQSSRTTFSEALGAAKEVYVGGVEAAQESYQESKKAYEELLEKAEGVAGIEAKYLLFAPLAVVAALLFYMRKRKK